MAFGDTPWGHYLAMAFSWFSAFVYIAMMFSIYRDRRVLFRNSYIPLFVAHSFTDFLLFLQAELMSQPRKYNWFNLFHENMTFFAQLTFFYGSTVRYALYVGHVVNAFNRFTVLQFPLDHNRMWKPFVIILFSVACWWMALLFVIPGFVLYGSDIKFEKRGNGFQLIGGRYIEFDSFYGSFLTYISLAACIFFYSYCFIKLPKILENKNFISEKRILICAAFSFLPFLLGTARGLMSYFSEILDMPSLWIISNDLWYYDTELTFCAQVWINLLMLKQVQESVLRFIKRRPKLKHTSVEHRSSVARNTTLPTIVEKQPAPPPSQCCCPPPPPQPSCSMPYSPQPYAPQQQYPYRNARKRRAASLKDLEGKSSDNLCNSPEVRRILRESMTDSETTTREQAMAALKDFETEAIVICTPTPFNFTISRDSEYCSEKGEAFTCFGFVF